jgi:hypothetical protein
MSDIAADRYDAGVRFGESLAQDTIAVRVGPDMRFALVATKGFHAGLHRPWLPGRGPRGRVMATADLQYLRITRYTNELYS